MTRVLALLLWLAPVSLAYGQQNSINGPIPELGPGTLPIDPHMMSRAPSEGEQQPPLMPDQPYARPADDFKCIADAKATIAKFGKAIADDDADDMRLFSGVQATAILKTINEAPPPTNFKGDALMALLHHAKSEGPMAGEGGGGSVLIFLISDECITGSMPKMSMGAWASILHEAIGDDA